MKKTGIVMGSDSDLPVIKKATDQLTALGIPFAERNLLICREEDGGDVFYCFRLKK